MSVFIGLLPLVLIFLLGLITKNIPNRKIHKYPPSRGIQFIDEIIQRLGAGRIGPLLTEIINGAAHSSLFYGVASFITPISNWRWEIAAMVFSIWFSLGISRSYKYIPKLDPTCIKSVIYCVEIEGDTFGTCEWYLNISDAIESYREAFENNSTVNVEILSFESLDKCRHQLSKVVVRLRRPDIGRWILLQDTVSRYTIRPVLDFFKTPISREEKIAIAVATLKA